MVLAVQPYPKFPAISINPLKNTTVPKIQCLYTSVLLKPVRPFSSWSGRKHTQKTKYDTGRRQSLSDLGVVTLHITGLDIHLDVRPASCTTKLDELAYMNKLINDSSLKPDDKESFLQSLKKRKKDLVLRDIPFKDCQVWEVSFRDNETHHKIDPCEDLRTLSKAQQATLLRRLRALVHVDYNFEEETEFKSNGIELSVPDHTGVMCFISLSDDSVKDVD